MSLVESYNHSLLNQCLEIPSENKKLVQCRNISQIIVAIAALTLFIAGIVLSVRDDNSKNSMLGVGFGAIGFIVSIINGMGLLMRISGGDLKICSQENKDAKEVKAKENTVIEIQQKKSASLEMKTSSSSDSFSSYSSYEDNTTQIKAPAENGKQEV